MNYLLQLGKRRNADRERGVTFVELLVVMGIVAIIFTMTIINIAPLRDNTLMATTLTAMITDIKQQQIKAMIGDTDGSMSRNPYGVYLQTGSYTVYPGSTYSAANTKNFMVEVDPSIVMTSTFPNNTIVFASGSGDLANFSNGQNTVTLRIAETGEQKIVTFNKYGIVVSVQ